MLQNIDDAQRIAGSYATLEAFYGDIEQISIPYYNKCPAYN